jgi:MoxR-like ATPase
VHDISNYIVRGKLWEAFESEEPVVLLIDEIDKADIEFPNDLLLEIDRMQFHVYETKRTVEARHRPIVLITSKQREGAAGRLPPPLLLPLHPLPRPRDDGAHRPEPTTPTSARSWRARR